MNVICDRCGHRRGRRTTIRGPGGIWRICWTCIETTMNDVLEVEGRTTPTTWRPRKGGADG